MIRKLRALFADKDSLGARAISAGLYRFGGHGAGMALRLGGNLIMTRLLAPEAFGLMAMVSAVQVAMVMFSDIGLRTAIVRSPAGDEPSFLRTAWTMQVLQFIAVSAGVAGAGVLLWSLQGHVDFGDTVYGDPALPFLLLISTIAMMAQGMRSMNTALATRRVLQGRLTIVEVAAQAIGVGSMLCFAMIAPSVYALVFGMVITSVAGMTMTHLVLPGPRMKPELSRDHVKEIWSFGRWLVGASILGFFGNHGDRLVLSAFMSKEQLGLYAIAVLLVNAVQMSFARVLAPVTAALSELWRERRHDLPRGFARVQRVYDAVSLASAFALVLAGTTIVEILYNDAFSGAGLYLSLLAFKLASVRYQPFHALLLTAGDSRRIATATLVTSVAMLAVSITMLNTLGAHWATLFIALNPLWTAPLLINGVAPHVPVNRVKELAIAALVIIAGVTWASVMI
ncbi:MAG: oligosaccharide flippase family protein [Pseudomonadota bacterium]